MFASQFRRFIVLFVMVGLLTAVLRLGTAVTAQQPTEPPVPEERALLPHFPAAETGDAGGAILSPHVPAWSRGVFQSYRDGNWEIYSSQPPYRLTNIGSSDIHPRYNRGATRIVFSSNRDGDYEIFVINADGSGLQQFTHNAANDVNPIWSPDGSQIAFQSYRDGQAEVYVMDANGLNERRLTAHGSYDGEPTWSPDGSQIAFTSARTGTPYIYVMNSDGTGVTRLSNQPSVYPAWSPDGSQIAYSGDQDGDGWLELWLMNADGSNQHMIYDISQPQIDVWARGWSPDGRAVTFTVIEFIQYGGNWYWQRAAITQYELATGYTDYLDSSGLNWHPDWQTVDVTPPATEVEPMSTFSQLPGFRVSWSGTDQQLGAGVATYDVQYRVDASGPWVDWQMGVTTTLAVYTAVPGTTVSFRARARDNAFNVETWSTTNNPTTTFYTWSLGGKVTDNRGVPITQAPLAISPLPLNEARTDDAGNFFSRLKTVGSHTIDVSRSGYGDLAQTSLNMENLAHIYLPPANSVLLNGGFEVATPLNNWTTTGTVTAVTNPHHTGTKSAQQGSNACSYPCLTEAENPAIPYAHMDMGVDSQGVVHAVFYQNYSIHYASRSASGVWSDGESFPSENGDHPKITIENNDNLHVLWAGDNQAYYRYKLPGGSWSATSIVATLANSFLQVASVVADSQGGLHVLLEKGEHYNNLSGSYYLYRQPDGIWQTPVPLTIPDYPFFYGNGLMAIGADDSLHIIWLQQELTTAPWTNELFYVRRLANGNWTNTERLSLLGNDHPAFLEGIAVASNETVHITWSGVTSTYQYATYHATRAANGLWSGRTIIRLRDSSTTDRFAASHISVDSRGNLHAILADYVFPGAMFNYRLWQPASGWQPVVPLVAPGVYFETPRVVVDPYDIVHMLIPEPEVELNYFRTLPAAGNNTAVLSQQVTIPANMPAPTLAFMAQRPGDLPDDGSGLELLVSDGVTTTAVPLPNGGAAWAHYWADMSPWAGQTVTVNFRLTQVSGDPRVLAVIDDVTLGSAYPDTWVRGGGPGSALPGETVVFTLHYGNNGRVPSTAAELALTWPDALTFVSASITPTVGANTLTWDVGDLAAEAAPATIVVTATVDAAIPFWQTINLPVSLNAATTEIEQQNNQAVISILIAYRQFLPMLAKP